MSMSKKKATHGWRGKILWIFGLVILHRIHYMAISQSKMLTGLLSTMASEVDIISSIVTQTQIFDGLPFERDKICRIAVTNVVPFHHETLESIANLFPAQYLPNVQKSCNKKPLLFDYHIFNDSQERISSWIEYFQRSMRHTNVSNDKQQRFIGNLSLYQYEGFGTPMNVTGDYDVYLEASCYCHNPNSTVPMSRKLNHFQWLFEDTRRACIFHESCPYIMNQNYTDPIRFNRTKWFMDEYEQESLFPRSVWVSPHHPKYYIPTILPDRGKTVKHATNKINPLLCTLGAIERRDARPLAAYLHDHPETTFHFRFISRGEKVPEELLTFAEEGLVSINTTEDFSRFHAMVQECDAILPLILKERTPDYFDIPGSKRKLSGIIPILIAYKKPAVIHEDLYLLYRHVLPKDVLYERHSDAHFSFDDTLTRFMDTLFPNSTGAENKEGQQIIEVEERNRTKLPPCRIAVTNAVPFHLETLESIASLFPVRYLPNVLKACNDRSLLFDYYIFNDTQEGISSWVNYFQKSMHEKNVSNDKEQRFIGNLTLYEYDELGTHKNIIGDYDAYVEASCNCHQPNSSVPMSRVLNHLHWLVEDNRRVCIFHEECSFIVSTNDSDPIRFKKYEKVNLFRRSVWVSPHHPKYYIPSTLPGVSGKTVKHVTNTTNPLLCTTGNIDRRDTKALASYLSNHPETTFHFRFISLSKKIPEELVSFVAEGRVSIKTTEDFSRFHAMVQECDAILPLILKERTPDYFDIPGSKKKLSGIFPILIAYKKPAVIHEDLYLLYRRVLPEDVFYERHSDELFSFDEALTRFMDAFHNATRAKLNTVVSKG